MFLRQAVKYYLRARKEWFRVGDIYKKDAIELIISDGSEFRDIYKKDAIELIILDGSEFPNPDFRLANHLIDSSDGFHTIQYYHEPSKPHTKTGPLHNRACELAQGDIIIQWDDDDWQAPDRIIRQIYALNGADSFTSALALTSQYYGYHLADKKAFRSRCWGNGLGSLGSAFAFHRSVWEKVPFRNVDQAEDQGFLEDCIKADIPIYDMKDPSYFIYIRHNQNGSAHSNNNYELEATIASRSILSEDINFYDELSEILPLSQWNHPTTFGQYGIYSKTRSPLYGKVGLPQPNVPLGNQPYDFGNPVNKK
jgi:hypothetical protein